jgi:hypothetical protein
MDAIDAVSAEPLFPDLDAYYETLREIDNAEHVEEAV